MKPSKSKSRQSKRRNVTMAPYQRTSTEALKLGRSLLKTHKLVGWQIAMDRAKTRAGATYYEDERITVSEEYARKVPIDMLKNLYLHEIAHAMVGSGHGHDAVWQQKVLSIGGSDSIAHNVTFAKPKYLCKCGDFTFERHRMMTRSRCKNTDLPPDCIEQT